MPSTASKPSPAPRHQGGPVLSVRHLTTSFRTDQGTVTAVDDISFDVLPMETLGIVGESGCGKTVTSKSIMRLLPEHTTCYGLHSEILLNERNLLRMPQREMRQIRGKRIAMIFQEPMTALNPVFTVGWQIEEALKYHTRLSRSQRRARAEEVLELVEIPNPRQRLREYPHQLSGGMRQRVMIAIAISCQPDILIADEPTTALDVTIQAQILRLMADLQRRIGTAIVLITHDLGVVAQICDRVLVMYAGQIVEKAEVRESFHRPRHPYTRALLDSIPKPGEAKRGSKLATIPGVVPSLWQLPEGCRFHDRCRYCEPKCQDELPKLEELSPGHLARCFYPLDVRREEQP